MTSPDQPRSFRNSPESFMTEALSGLIAAHPNARWDERGFLIDKNLSLPSASFPVVDRATNYYTRAC